MESVYRKRPSLGEFCKRYALGRILVINTIIFAMMAYESGSIMMPSTEVLLGFGANSPLHLVQGEWWRLITPIFVHIGLIHFLFNSYAIFILGLQLEPMVSTRFMIPLYFVSGILGNIASSFFTAGLSAGASSSIFGMLGCGLIIERAFNKKLKEETNIRPARGMYTSLIFINLLLGFMIPAIDNAAHIGGLVAGIILTLAYINFVPNRVQKRRTIVSIPAALLLVSLIVVGSVGVLSPSLVTKRFMWIADRNSESDPRRALMMFTNASQINTQNPTPYLKRARLLLMHGGGDIAVEDLRYVSKTLESPDKVVDFINEIGDEIDGDMLKALRSEFLPKSI